MIANIHSTIWAIGTATVIVVIAQLFILYRQSQLRTKLNSLQDTLRDQAKKREEILSNWERQIAECQASVGTANQNMQNLAAAIDEVDEKVEKAGKAILQLGRRV